MAVCGVAPDAVVFAVVPGGIYRLCRGTTTVHETGGWSVAKSRSKSPASASSQEIPVFRRGVI